jgi:hypothetical protein
MQSPCGCALITRVSSWLVYSTIARTSVKKQVVSKHTTYVHTIVSQAARVSQASTFLVHPQRKAKNAEII